MRRCLLITGMTLSLSGCVTALTETANTIAGGYSDFYVVSRNAAVPLYDSVVFTPLQNLVGERVSEDVLRVTNESISNALRQNQFRVGGNRPLYVDGFIIHADEGFLSNDIVVRLRLIDPETWQVVREANLVGKAKGVNDLKEAAKAIGDSCIKLLDTTPPSSAGYQSSQQLQKLYGNQFDAQGEVDF